MKYLFIMLVVFMSAVVRAYSLTIDCTAGSLSRLLVDRQPGQISQLTVTGSIDVRDIMYIAGEMPSLAVVDLGGAEVVAYSQSKALIGNFVCFEAGEFPPLSMMGSGIEEIVLPSGVMSIGEGAFAGCSRLRRVSLPDGLRGVGDYAFSGATALTAVSGGRDVTHVGSYAFAHCSALEGLPDWRSLESVGAYAFYECRALRTFSFYDGLSRLGTAAFGRSGLEYADLMNCNGLDTIPDWLFADADGLGAVTFPDGIAAMGEGTLYDCDALHLVSLPSGIERIENFMFAESNLQSDHILPTGVREIGEFAFADLPEAEGFVLPASVEYIGEGAFRNCTSLSTLLALPVAPPALGRDVWEGVNQPDVTLFVPEHSALAYKNADQWKDFYFSSVASPEATANSLTVRTMGSVVRVESSQAAITQATLYDMTGMALRRENPSGPTVEFDLSPYTARVFVIACMLENGRSEFVKTGRDR